MEFDGTSFTVPEDGLYYIYGQLVIKETVTKDCEFSIVNSNSRPHDILLSVTHPASPDKNITIFGSQVRRLNPSNKVAISTSNCSYSFEAEQAHFGMFQLKVPLSPDMSEIIMN